VQIANPIYDVVFKYLMEDSKIAKLVISSIIGEEIEELNFLPQEFVSTIRTEQESKKPKARKNRKDTLTVFRLDFSAKIRTAQGLKQVIIELQKAKFPKDIMRFRKYLGEQFSNKENFQKIRIGNRIRKTGIPILSIYFLGHKLDYTKSSAIKVSRQYHDLITGEVIDVKEAFIESLTLDSYVIQIPYLTGKRRNDLEILLSVFDQSHPADKDHHILNIEERNFPEKYSMIIRKLQKAVQDTEIKKKMELEDGIIDEMEDMEREIEDLTQENEQVKQKLDVVEQENEQVKQKLDVVEQQNEQVKQKLDVVEQENEQVKQKLDVVEQEKQALLDELEQLRRLLSSDK